MPKTYFDYTNHKGSEGPRQAEPMAIRYGSSNYHGQPQWLMLGYDYKKDAPREYAMRDMVNVRPGQSWLVFTKDTMRKVVTRLEEIAEYRKLRAVDVAPVNLANAVRLAQEALKELSRDKGDDDVDIEQSEKLFLPETMPPLTELYDVLGTHPGRAITFAQAAREAGHVIPYKAEAEWAFIHWTALGLYLRHNGKDAWRQALQDTFDGFIAEARRRLEERGNPDAKVDLKVDVANPLATDEETAAARKEIKPGLE